MHKVLFRYACLGLVLVLCLPLVACDMKMGGLLGKLLEFLPEISGDQMGQIEDVLTEEDILHGVPVPDYTTPDYSYHYPETNVPDYTYDYPETTNPDYTYPDQTEEWVTETQPPYETEDPTIDDIPPMPDPVLVFASIDHCFTTTNQLDFFIPGQFMEWNKVGKIDDYTVESICIWGWAAFTSEAIGVFGYQIDEQEPVFDTAFWLEAEEAVWQAALSMGAKSASRMNFVIPVRDLSGAHTIRLLAQDQVGTIDIMGEFTIIKAEDPYAPVLMLNPYDIEQATLNSWGHQIASATVDATGSYVTLDATGSDPDIPGIIEGASNNRGLGHEFLRHIMRCHLLLFVVDLTGLEHDPVEAIQTLRKEVKLYSDELAARPWVIIANKMDEPCAVENLEILRQRFPKVEIIPISAAMGDGIPAFKERLQQLLKEG